MIKLEFDGTDRTVAAALGRALLEIAGEAVAPAGSSLKDVHVHYTAETPDGGEVSTDTPTPDEPPAAEVEERDDAAPESNGQVDCNRVPHNADMCSSGKNPFYTSGANEGQWKKRRGIAEAVFNKWYTDQLVEVDVPEQTDTSPDTAGAFQQPTMHDQYPNAASAFSGGQQQTAPEEPVPSDCGEFMGWVSERQAAGVLTAEQIGAAYAHFGIQVVDLFPPTPAEQVAQHVRNMHAYLSQGT